MAEKTPATRRWLLAGVMSLDTSSEPFANNQRQTCELVGAQILDWVDEQIEENIFSIRKGEVSSIFGANQVVSATDSERLISAFTQGGDYKPRSVVEADYSRVQALPIVVVRNNSGEILLLRRREKKPDDKLHEKLVIWAGGHVRKEDSVDGNPIEICAVRELQEELRLRITPNDLSLLGSIYVDLDSSAKHVAIVYEWKAHSGNVAVALNKSEFFERHGTSVSCNFVERSLLLTGGMGEPLTEKWSKIILERLLLN